MEDFYDILGIEFSSSSQEIKEAYRKLSKKLHPDVDPGNFELEEKFKILQLAYSVLKDPAKKRTYDAQLENYKNRLEQFKTYVRNMNPMCNVTTLPLSRSMNRNTDVKLKYGFKQKGTYRIGIAMIVVLITFSAIIFLEGRFYNGIHLEATVESVPSAVPLMDSLEFIKGFNDSTSLKKTQP